MSRSKRRSLRSRTWRTFREAGLAYSSKMSHLFYSTLTRPKTFTISPYVADSTTESTLCPYQLGSLRNADLQPFCPTIKSVIHTIDPLAIRWRVSLARGSQNMAVKSQRYTGYLRSGFISLLRWYSANSIVSVRRCFCALTMMGVLYEWVTGMRKCLIRLFLCFIARISHLIASLLLNF